MEINALVTSVFTDLGLEILDVPFSLESARSSFLKTVQKVPPSDKTQEFKDGVLWANCLELLEQDDVLLASQDKAFYLDRDYKRGLAENLAVEASQRPNKLTLVHSVIDVLKHVETDVDLDDSWLVSVIRQRAHAAAYALLSRSGAETAGEPLFQYDLFATENPDLLYLKYKIEIPCIDLTDGERTDMRLVMEGNGTLRPSVSELASVSVSEERLFFTNPDGSVGQLKNLYLSANVAIGHRTIPHSVQHFLKSAG